MCEKLFQTARSMTSTYFTVINFSIKDLIYRINRFKQTNAIINDLLEVLNFSENKKILKNRKCPNI